MRIEPSTLSTWDAAFRMYFPKMGKSLSNSRPAQRIASAKLSTFRSPALSFPLRHWPGPTRGLSGFLFPTRSPALSLNSRPASIACSLSSMFRHGQWRLYAIVSSPQPCSSPSDVELMLWICSGANAVVSVPPIQTMYLSKSAKIDCLTVPNPERAVIATFPAAITHSLK